MYGIVAVLCMVSVIVNFTHSSLYFATQGHSMINLRNVLHVWWQYEFCVETAALLCVLHCVQTIHNRTKTYVVKSLFVCNIVVHVLQIIVVWLQLIICEFLFTWCGQTLINFFCFCWCLPGTKSNRNGSKWHEFSRNLQSAQGSVVVLVVVLSSKFCANLS